MACMQISNFLKFGKIENSVNFPNINSDTVAKHRIFITNKNHPGIISQVAETLSNEKINILEVEHSRFTLDLSVRSARLNITLETRDEDHAKIIISKIKKLGFKVEEKKKN